jgi:DnaD/phage-associated family protein
MAGYRQFHTQFWKDEWVIELDPLERYLFSYLFTNDLSSISGIYKLPMRIIINETALDRTFVEAALQKFQDAERIYYRDGVMWVVNMLRFHKNASPHTMTKVNNDLAMIPDGPVKTAYLYYQRTGIYRIDTVSIPNSESVSVSVNKSENKNKSERDDAAAPLVDAPPADPIPDRGTWEPEEPERPNLFAVYEREIGLMTPAISDELKAAEVDYPPGWPEAAMSEAARQNKRSWAYTRAILERWKVDGFQSKRKKTSENNNGFTGRRHLLQGL